MIEARHLRAGYDGRAVIAVDAISIAPGDRVLVAGANGSGKTTLLKTLAGLLPPVSGSLTALRRGAGGAIYVHPAPFLYAGTGVHNVLLGAQGNREHAREAIDALKASSFAGLDVRTMSNGQRQRIALARALAARPAVLLVDEADSGLDIDGRLAWEALIVSRKELALVLASHDAARLQKAGYRILSLQGAQ